MMDLKAVKAFLSKTALSSSFPMCLLLIALEALIDHEFSCPCSGYSWNIGATFFVFVTPPIFACALMIFYERFFQNSNNNREEKTFACITNYIIPVCVWLFIILLDGQYVACCNAGWQGTYVFNGKLNRKWCQPSANVSELQEKYEKVIYQSQMAGYLLVLVLSVGLSIASCSSGQMCPKYCDGKKQSNSPTGVQQELVVVFPNTICTEGHINTIPVDIQLRNVTTANEVNEGIGLINCSENRN